MEILGNSRPELTEIDTGASISLINYKTFIKLYDNKARINPTSSCIQTYAAEIIKPNGSTEAKSNAMGRKLEEEL